MTIHWGILGCGKVAEVKSGPGFQKADGSELVYVMRRDAELAEDYARRHGVARWTTDADELISRIRKSMRSISPPRPARILNTPCEWLRRASRPTWKSRCPAIMPSAGR